MMFSRGRKARSAKSKPFGGGSSSYKAGFQAALDQMRGRPGRGQGAKRKSGRRGYAGRRAAPRGYPDAGEGNYSDGRIGYRM